MYLGRTRRRSLPWMGLWGWTCDGCAELARAPALARSSKQATRDTQAQLCSRELWVWPEEGGMCGPTVS